MTTTITSNASYSALTHNGTEAVTFDATGITGGVPDLALGVNQTWTDVTASRAFNTLYTNTTGKPILVSIVVIGGTSGSFLQVDGVDVVNINANPTYSVTSVALVPNGSTYKTTNTGGTKINWVELR